MAGAPNLRISFARLLMSLGSLLQSLAIAVMRPRDLVERSRRGYSSAQAVGQWCSPQVVDPGLDGEETRLLANVPQRRGRLLLLGLGGGREAIPLARSGFDVTGVDFAPEMVAKARANAERHGVRFDTLVQDMAGLDVPPSSFDVVWFSRFMYSQIPTRKTRVRMLSRIASALKPGGSLVCCFWWNPDRKTTGRVEAVRKAVALLTFANPGYQPGDELHGQDFVHGFADRGELLAEFRDGGFETVYLQVSSDAFAGGAVLQASKGDGGAAQRAK